MDAHHDQTYAVPHHPDATATDTYVTLADQHEPAVGAGAGEEEYTYVYQARGAAARGGRAKRPQGAAAAAAVPSTSSAAAGAAAPVGFYEEPQAGSDGDRPATTNHAYGFARAAVDLAGDDYAMPTPPALPVLAGYDMPAPPSAAGVVELPGYDVPTRGDGLVELPGYSVPTSPFAHGVTQHPGQSSA